MRVVNDGVVFGEPLTVLRATQDHGAAVDVAHRRIRKDFSQYAAGVLIEMCPAALDAENLVVDHVDQVVVAGDRLQQRWRRGEDGDVLGAQDVAGLLENVIDIGRGLIHRAAGDQLLDPPRIQVDGEQHRIQRRRTPPLHLPEHVRTGGPDHQQPAVTKTRLLEQIGGIPRRELFLPVGQDDHPLGCSGGTTALVNSRSGRVGSIPGRHQVSNIDVAQLVHDVGEQRQILEGLDVGQWVEVQRVGALEPIPRSGIRPEMPLDRGLQICARIVNRLDPGQIDQRKIAPSIEFGIACNHG
jgi:hypothetical protein